MSLTDHGSGFQLHPILSLWASADALEKSSRIIPLSDVLWCPFVSQDATVFIVPAGLRKATVLVEPQDRLVDWGTQDSAFISRSVEWYGQTGKRVKSLWVTLPKLGCNVERVYEECLASCSRRRWVRQAVEDLKTSGIRKVGSISVGRQRQVAVCKIAFRHVRRKVPESAILPGEPSSIRLRMPLTMSFTDMPHSTDELLGSLAAGWDTRHKAEAEFVLKSQYRGMVSIFPSAHHFV